jgi:sugar phosphate isomerase/epimerase
MTHPRLSASQMCTYPWTFAEDLALWDDLGLRQAGLLVNKIDDYGHDATVAALTQRSMAVTTLITSNFDLSAPAGWDATRERVNGLVDLAAQVGGCPYFTPGPHDGRSVAQLTAALAEAVAPCVAYADARGVRLAIEPTLRPDRSFVHTLPDGIRVAEQAGVGLVVDLGNCWAEDDLAVTMRRAGPLIAVVQVCDAVTDAAQPPAPGDRAVPGDGNLDVAAFVEAALTAGYTGAFELELLGPRIAAEGYAAATRRAVERMSTLLEKVLP